MDRLHAVLLAITAVSTVIVASLVFVIPDHSGELRTDLEIGDYYVLHTSSDYRSTEYRIVDINQDGTLDVQVTLGSNISHQAMTQEQYLDPIQVSDDMRKVPDKRSIVDTKYGSRVCYLYTKNLGNYWADSHGVIFKSFVGGLNSELIECSLIKKRRAWVIRT